MILRATAALLVTLLCLAATGDNRAVAQVTSVSFDRYGRTLAAGGYRSITLIDTASGNVLKRLAGASGNVTALQFSPDGKWLAAAGGLPGRAGEVVLFPVAGGSPLTLSGPTDVVQSIAWSPDSRTLAGGSYDHDITLWPIRSPSPQSKIENRKSRILKDHIDSVYAVAFSPDGRLVASAAGDRTVKVWSATTGKRLYTLSESTAELFCVAFRPDGRQVAAGGADKQLRTWDVTPTAGTLAKSAFAHSAPILRVCYTPDGRSIVTGGEDNAAKRWDSRSLLEQKVYPKLPDWPQGIALSPNGRLLAIGCHNGRVAIFDTESGRIVREPMKGTAVAAKPADVPKTSAIPGRRMGDNKQRRPVSNGGVTLFAASLGDIAPRGAPRGGTVRFTLFGGLISDASRALFDDPAITATIVEPRDPNTGVVRVDANLGANVRPGIHRVFVQTPHGTTTSVPFAVGGWPESAQAEPNNTPAAAQKVDFPRTVVGALDQPGDVDCFRIDAKAGQELVFEVVAQQLRSRLQPVLALLDEEGRTIAEAGSRIGRPDALLGCRIPRDGAYILQLRDYEGAGGGDVHYRLNVGEFPVVTDVFPLGAQAGTTAEIQVQGFNLGAKNARVQMPADSGSNALVPLTLDTPRGPSLITRTLRSSPDPDILATGRNDSLAYAEAVSVPSAINGRLTPSTQHPTPNTQHFYRFHASKGERLTLDVIARRAGSSLDPEIEVLDSKGRPIERAVVRPVYQTEMTLSDRDSASNGFRIVAWDGVGIGDYLMVGREIVKVLEMPRGPDSDIFVRTFRGQRITYFDTTPEFHSVSQPFYKVEVHPAGSTFSPNGYPITRLTYRNDDGGPLFGKDSHLDFVAPDDGEYLVRIGDTRGQSGPEYTYRLLIHPPRPDYRLTMSPEHPNLPKGGGVVVTVECERYDGFDGPIDVRLEGLPSGFTATETTIEAGETSASILITAAADAQTLTELTSTSIRVVGRARIAGHEIVRTIEPENGNRLLTVMPGPDARVATDSPEVTIRPGEEISLNVRLDRQGKFGGRVPIEFRNLPFGVQVQNIGLNGILVTEEESERAVTIRCEPWVKPQTRPFYLVANIEGGVPSPGAPIMLRVVPGSGPRADQRPARVGRR